MMTSTEPQIALQPIREVSEQTGINPVTLRAWERRYGLITPQRTPKGHRLYSQQDIDRILQIKLWLSRGIAVGQVKPLLNDPESVAEDTAECQPEYQPDSEWEQTLNQNLKNLYQGQMIPFDHQLNQLTAIYPVNMVNRFFWQPLLEKLHSESDLIRQQGIRSQLYAYLRNRTGARLIHRNMHASNQPVWLLIPVPGQAAETQMCLSALSCTDLNIPVIVMDDCPDWTFLHQLKEQQALAGVVLFTPQKMTALSKRDKQLISSLPLPVYLSGSAAALHSNDEAMDFHCIDWTELADQILAQKEALPV